MNGGVTHGDMQERKRKAEAFDDIHRLRRASEYQDDDGTVLWWHVPICEPPYVGSGEGMDEKYADGKPTQCCALQRANWLTHWSRLPDTRLMDFK